MTTPSRIGIDAIEPDRIRKRLTDRPALREELFTAAELEYCDGEHDPYLHLAARFAAKEAVVKALALDGFDPLDIEIVAGDPAPSVRLRGGAQEQAVRLGMTVQVSMTHLASVAMAVALAEHSPSARGSRLTSGLS